MIRLISDNLGALASFRQADAYFVSAYLVPASHPVPPFVTTFHAKGLAVSGSIGGGLLGGLHQW